MQTRQSILERCRKLLALSRSTNEHEAALAMQRARELLSAHQLDLTDVTAETTAVSDIAELQTSPTRTASPHVAILAQSAAVLWSAFCFRRRSPHGLRAYCFVAPRDVLPTVAATFSMLIDTCERSLRYDRRALNDTPRSFNRDYRIAFARAVYTRAKILADTARRATTARDTGRALVVTSEAAISDYVRANVGPMSSGARFTHRPTSTGSTLGRSAGDRCALGSARVSAPSREVLR